MNSDMTGQKLYELMSPDISLYYHKKRGTVKWGSWENLTAKEQHYWLGLAQTYER